MCSGVYWQRPLWGSFHSFAQQKAQVMNICVALIKFIPFLLIIDPIAQV